MHSYIVYISLSITRKRLWNIDIARTICVTQKNTETLYSTRFCCRYLRPSQNADLTPLDIITSCPIDADIKNGHLIFANASNDPDQHDTELFECGALGREFWIEILAENVYRFHCNDNFCSFSERTYTHFVFDMVVTDME